MRRAFLAGDASYDGVFFTGVKTTGIFCRPSCTARKPRPENVEFFASPREAMFSGYRACKRCHPLDADGRPPAWVARLLERARARARRAHPRGGPARGRHRPGTGAALFPEALRNDVPGLLPCAAAGRRLPTDQGGIERERRGDWIGIRVGERLSGRVRARVRHGAGRGGGGRSRGARVDRLAGRPADRGRHRARARASSSSAIAACSRRSSKTLRKRLGAPLVPGRHRWLDVAAQPARRVLRRPAAATSTCRW